MVFGLRVIWNFYGVCSLCNENEELYKFLKEYEIMVKKEDFEYKEWDNIYFIGVVNCNCVVIIVYEF